MLLTHFLPKSINFLKKILNFDFEVFFHVIELDYMGGLQLTLIEKTEFLGDLIEYFKKISFVVITFFG